MLGENATQLTPRTGIYVVNQPQTTGQAVPGRPSGSIEQEAKAANSIQPTDPASSKQRTTARGKQHGGQQPIADSTGCHGLLGGMDRETHLEGYRRSRRKLRSTCPLDSCGYGDRFGRHFSQVGRKPSTEQTVDPSDTRAAQQQQAAASSEENAGLGGRRRFAKRSTILIPDSISHHWHLTWNTASTKSRQEVSKKCEKRQNIDHLVSGILVSSATRASALSSNAVPKRTRR